MDENESFQRIRFVYFFVCAAFAGSHSTNEEQRETSPAKKPSPAVATTRSDSALMVREKAAGAAPKVTGNREEADSEPRKEIFLTAVSVSELPRTADQLYSG